MHTNIKNMPPPHLPPHGLPSKTKNDNNNNNDNQTLLLWWQHVKMNKTILEA